MKKKTKIRKHEGLPVVDATKSIILHITPQDIKGSRKADPNNCAAARACKREFGKETKVFLTRMYIKEKKNWVRYLTPESISREITAFDRGASFEPGEYKVKPASESAKLGNHRSPNGKTRSNDPHNPKPYHVTANVREYKK